MKSFNETGRDKIRIRCVLMFVYMFLCCLNQYVKVMGIPLFICILLLYSCVKICSDSFLIRNSIGAIWKPFSWHFLFFVVWIAIGIIFAFIVNNEAGWRNILYIVINIIGYYSVFSDCYYFENIRKWCIKGLGAGIWANIIVALWELKSGKHIMTLSEDYIRRFASRPLGFYVNTNDLAIVLIFMLTAFAVGYIYNTKSLSRTIVFAIISITGCGIIVSTGSVISIAAIMCLVLFSVLYYQFRNKNKAGYLIIVMGIFFIFMVLAIDGESIISMFASIDESAFLGRQEIWKITWDLFQSTMFLGIGPGQNTVVGYGSVHNLALEILSEYGCIIGLLFISLFVSLIKGIMKLKKSFVNSVVVSFGFLFIPLSICSSSMTKLFPIWPCIGLLFAFAFNDNEREEMIYDYNGSTDISY